MKRNILTDEELFEIKAREYERGLKDAKPVVGESLIKIYVKMIKDDPHQCIREILIGMLREAGVEVIIDSEEGKYDKGFAEYDDKHRILK